MKIDHLKRAVLPLLLGIFTFHPGTSRATTGPTVAITSPANGATIQGIATIWGTSAGSVALSSVAVSIDGGSYSLVAGTASWAFDIVTQGLANGAHTLRAQVWDALGNTAVSASIGVTVNNSGPVTRLSLNGSKILDATGKPILLHGFDWGGWGFAQPQDAADNAAQGANAVRLVLFWWGPYSPGTDSRNDAAPGHVDPAHLIQFDAMISSAAANHLYIDLAVDSNCGQASVTWDTYANCGTGNDGNPANFENDPAMKQEFIELWEFLANRYKSVPYIGMYELLVEPNLASDFYPPVISSVHLIDPATPLMIGPPTGYNLKKLFTAYISTTTPIIYTGDNLDTDSHNPLLLSTATNFAAQMNVPVFIQQEGVLSGDSDAVATSTTILSDLAADNIGWTWWEYRTGTSTGNYGPFYQDTKGDWVELPAWLAMITSFFPADTTPPVVTISAPTEGATIRGTVAVTGASSDNVAVSSVAVSIDGGAYGAATGTANWSLSFNTLLLANGAHTLQAAAWDTSGNTSTSRVVNVTVLNSAAQTVLLGDHVDNEGSNNSESDFAVLESSVGRTLAIDSDYEDWYTTSSPSGFPDASRVNWDKTNGRTTMISWRTDYDGADATQGCATASSITAGSYDSQLIAQALAAKALGAPILVRWHYEMTDNDDDTCFNNGVKISKNNSLTSGPNFVASWQHIVNIFKQQGAANVQWVWAPSANMFSNTDGTLDTTTWRYYYPGDNYVDWIAEDNYNKIDSTLSYAADTGIANFYVQMASRGKPLMQSETGANEDPALNPDPQTVWLQTAHAALKAQYPAFKAFVYWDVYGSAYLNSNPPGYTGTGYQLNGPGAAQYVQIAQDPYFQAMGVGQYFSSTGGGPPPTITTAPLNTAVFVGQVATFTVVAAGSPPLAYQWFKNGVAVASMTSASAVTSPEVLADNGALFYCLVTNTVGFVTSSSATLTVTSNVLPSITTPPAAASVFVGQVATFSVVAAGTPPLNYQWLKNGVVIASASIPTYMTPAEVLTDNGALFSCRVSNSSGTVFSSSATLSVSAVLPVITSQPSDVAVLVGQTASFAVSAVGTPPLAYQWLKNGSDIAFSTNSTYTTPQTVLGDDGTVFSCLVSNSSGTVLSSTATLSVSAAPRIPKIKNQPTPQSVYVGQIATFTVTANGTAPLAYQWLQNGASIPGANAATYMTAPEVLSDNGAQFSCMVSNSSGTVYSSSATLTVTAIAPSIITAPASTSVFVGQVATFTVTAAGSAPLSYQWLRNGVPIASATSAAFMTSTETLADNGAQFSCMVANSSATVFSSSATLAVVAILPLITAQPADASVLVGQIATFTVTAAGSPPLNYQWLKNGASIPSAAAAAYSTPPEILADDGAQFSCMVSNSSGTVFSSSATLSVSSSVKMPKIKTQPTDQFVYVGQIATFTVTASGTMPLAYQWLKNGVGIPFATAATYVTPPEVITDNGALFSCLVSNSSGSVVSSTAALTVTNVAPTIVTQPVPASVFIGQVATFSVVAAGSPPLTYQWLKNGANISGATAANYTTPPEPFSDNGSVFSCVVSNSAGSTPSNFAALSVSSQTAGAPTVSTQPAVAAFVVPGTSALLSVVAAGALPLSYQWLENGIVIPGATSPTYVTPPAGNADNLDTFLCLITNSAGYVFSSPATLIVWTAPGFDPNMFSGSQSIATSSGGVGSFGFSNGVQTATVTVVIPANVFVGTVGLLMDPPPAALSGAVTSPTPRLTQTGIGVSILSNVPPIAGAPIALTFSNLAGLPSGGPLLVAYQDPMSGIWYALPTQLNGDGTITAFTTHFTLFALLQSLTAAADLGAAKVFPNPFRPALGHTSVTFTNLTAGARVRIYTLTGELARDLTADGDGNLVWDVRNSAGANLASGVYFAFIQGEGQKKIMKVAVQR